MNRVSFFGMVKCITLMIVFGSSSNHNIHVSASLTDKATGITFLPRLKSSGGEELEVTAVGVRKKGPIKVYSVAMYTSAVLKESLSTLSKTANKAKALATLRSGAGTDRPVSFLLEMSFKAGAEKMASAIADSVAPRHSGNASDVDQLKQLILDGVNVNTKTGTAVKGTKFQFDCSNKGVGVAINGKGQGNVPSPSLSSAFCDVYLDGKAVSPALCQNCLDNWCQE